MPNIHTYSYGLSLFEHGHIYLNMDAIGTFTFTSVHCLSYAFVNIHFQLENGKLVVDFDPDPNGLTQHPTGLQTGCITQTLMNQHLLHNGSVWIKC